MACRPTELLQSGRTQESFDGKIKNVMVIAYPGMLKSRAEFEKAAKQGLARKGLQINSLREVLGKEDSLYRSQPEKLHQYLRESGVDGLIEVRFVSMRKEETNAESAYPTRREYRIMDDTHYNKLIQEYDKREEKGAIFENTKVKMDIKAFALIDGKYKVIWSSRTESSNPRNNQSIAKSCIKKAKKALNKEGILP